MDLAPSSDNTTRASDKHNSISVPSLEQINETAARANIGRSGKKDSFDPWAVGGVLLLSLSASADAVLTDSSKVVRAKAIACSLRILETHGSRITSGVRCGDAINAGKASVSLNGVKNTLTVVRRVVSDLVHWLSSATRKPSLP